MSHFSKGVCGWLLATNLPPSFWWAKWVQSSLDSRIIHSEKGELPLRPGSMRSHGQFRKLGLEPIQPENRIPSTGTGCTTTKEGHFKGPLHCSPRKGWYLAKRFCKQFSESSTVVLQQCDGPLKCECADG